MSSQHLIQRAMSEADDALRAVRAFHVDDREQVRQVLQGMPLLALLALCDAALAEVARSYGISWDGAADAVSLALMEVANTTEEDQ